MAVHYVKQFDKGREITDTLYVPGLTSLEGCTVQFFAVGVNNDGSFYGNATITNSALKQVKYTTTDTDFDIVGNYDCEWRVTLPGGALRVTVPSDSYNVICVKPSLAEKVIT